MAEADPPEQVEKEETPGIAALSAETILTAAPSIISGVQMLEYADRQIRIDTAKHTHQIERDRLDHELQETTRDNMARRMRESRDDAARRMRENITFYTCIGVPIAGLIFGAALSIWTSDETTKLFAHNLISLIFGGILGGLAGYFTAKGR